MKVLKFIILLIFGLMFINSGLNKLFHYLPVPEMSEQLMQVENAFATITWLMPLVGIVEIIGGLFVIIPRTRALGAIILFPIMVGIILHHLYFAPESIIMAGVFLLINIWLLVENRKKYQPMLTL